MVRWILRVGIYFGLTLLEGGSLAERFDQSASPLGNQITRNQKGYPSLTAVSHMDGDWICP
jgi:hypothetical protein